MGPLGGAVRPGRFFGVYLLYCLNPRHRGRVYVGFTVNPARRVQQHNGGRKKGGAWRTSGRGPWEMVLLVHGFPSAVAALRVRQAPGPLTLRWLRPDFCRDLCPPPPPHMPLAFGPLPASRARKDDGEPATDRGAQDHCTLCALALQDEEGPLRCPHPGCVLRAHVICLAEEFLQAEPGQLVPLEGQCPRCKNSLLWGDLLSLCQMGSKEDNDDSDFEEVRW
ncbi:Structure-specific endonuclease subunit SLX1, partial [Heterocephalus glaber]